MKMSGRALTALLAIVLLIGCAAGGTVAWLATKTDAVVNTFTVGDISIKMKETTGEDYHIVPGVDIKKNPTVTVENGNEPCYLFVKIDKTNWPDVKEENGTPKVNYTIAGGWIELENVSGVYYREVESLEEDKDFKILKDDQITVSDTLTKKEANRIAEGAETDGIKLTFTAYAIQKANFANANEAWTAASTNIELNTTTTG